MSNDGMIENKLAEYLLNASKEDAKDTLFELQQIEYNENLEWLYANLPQNITVIQRTIKLPNTHLN